MPRHAKRTFDLSTTAAQRVRKLSEEAERWALARSDPEFQAEMREIERDMWYLQAGVLDRAC